MGCLCLQYTVTPGIDPWQQDSPAEGPLHPTDTCVATHSMAPRSHYSTRQCSISHGKCVTRLSQHCYFPSFACPIPRIFSNRAYVGSFGIESWASHEFERNRSKFSANMERNVS
ncbi:hypothetical protein TNCV_3334381 [Trichonephila clavipes]|nr:hypothetical protein TNCV_3334381 [Trichonephila clavipes]